MRRLTVFLGTLVMCCALPLAHAEKVLRYAFPIAETGFDPAGITDLYSRVITTNIFDAPLRYTWLSPGKLEPNTLTEMPTISADFKTFTFHLKPGIYFSDDPAFNGKKRELTADDYVYSFKRIYDPRWHSPIYGELEPYAIASVEKLRTDAIKSGHFDYDTPVEGIRSLDRYTWEVKLGVAAPRFAANVYYDSSIFGAVAREVVEKYGASIMEHPVGTGPYMLHEWVRSSKMVFVKNPNYRQDLYHAEPAANDKIGQQFAARFEGHPMPFIDRIEISVVEESQPRWLAFLNAEHDLISAVPSDMVSLAYPNNKLAPNLAKKGLIGQRVPALQASQIIFNMDDKVVGGYTPEKVALRRAIGLGTNIPTIIANIYHYEAIPAQSVILPRQYGYDPNMRSEMGDYDVARANAMLDTYGYARPSGSKYRNLPDGTPFTLTILAEPDQLSRSLDEVIKKSMDDLGIQVDFSVGKWPEHLKAVQTGTYQVWFLGESSTTLDPNDGFQSNYGPAKGGDNLVRFDLPEFNQMFEKQGQMPDSPERLALLMKMRDILNAYEPAKFTWNPVGIYLNYPWVIGYRRDPLIADWWRYVDIDEKAQAPHLQRAN